MQEIGYKCLGREALVLRGWEAAEHLEQLPLSGNQGTCSPTEATKHLPQVRVPAAAAAAPEVSCRST